ncbi:MAG: glycosylase family protein [Adhaeribacter sp.]|nr:glycosylase family protein [Adhaeribacter sp.]
MQDTFADKVIQFNKSLHFTGVLPAGIRIMNPFREDEKIIPLASAFYQKFYADNNPRYMILGINPGRFGGGVTGVPFTDSKRLKNECDIAYTGKETHEPSSVFVYEVIKAYGGVKEFYQKFYINSICPLGFTATAKTGKEVNYNYYDSRELTAAVSNFIIQSIQAQIALGINTDICFCFGTGKNEKFLRQLNATHKFFENIVVLEHPRFVMQYKARSKEVYINKYLEAFNQAG